MLYVSTRKGEGNLYDTQNSMSINKIECRKNDTGITATSSLVEPGKLIVGVDCTCSQQ